MEFDTLSLDESGIQLIDGDRGKNYPKQSDFLNNDYCLFLSAKNVTANGFDFSDQVYIDIDKDGLLKAGKVCRGDIIVTTRGTIGNIAFYDDTVPFENIRINSGMIIFRADDKLWNRRFLYFLLNSKFIKQQITSLTSGSAVPQLPVRDLKRFLLPNIPLVIQNRITEVIGSISDKIELNRQINQTLEQIAQTIFKSWFVDFEPVKAKIAAKAAGRDPERAAMCAISGKTAAEIDQLTAEQLQHLSATAALFPDELVKSELGLVPVGWEVKNLSDVVEINPKRTLKKGKISTYLDMKNMPTQGHLAADSRLREFGSGTKFINGDTLMARITPCLENGKTAFVDFLKNGETGWGSTEYIVMRPKEPVPVLYAYLIARDKKFRSFAIQNMTGTSGRQRVNAKSLESYPIASPTDSKFYKAFSNFISPLFLEISSNGSAHRSLSEIRDGLLPKLLSGKIHKLNGSNE